MKDMQSLPELSQLSHAQKDELILALWQLVGSLEARVQALEGRLALNSTNSSKPPSSDGLNKPAPKSLRQRGQRPSGGQRGHSGSALRQSAHIDHVVLHHSAPECTHCHAVLLDHEAIEQRQVFELPVLRAQVTQHRLMRSTCRCGAVHLGAFPTGINAPAQYGPRARAFAAYLNQHHLVPLERTTQVMRDAFGLEMSQASVQAFGQQAASALSATVQAIGLAVQAAPIVHADESGIRVRGKLQWLHCLVTPTLSWLSHHGKRGAQAFEALGLLAGVRATLVHDGLMGYKTLECTHSLCNAHHLRELVFVHERCDEKIWDNWAQEMIDVLLQAKAEVAQNNGPLPHERQQWYEQQWEALLVRGERFNPAHQHTGAPTGKRGRQAQSKAFNLLARLRKYRHDVWRFMTDKDVPFTNNLAEQALRMAKVKQKISGGFRTEEGATTFFTIRSYLATMNKQGADLMSCLLSAFNGQPIQPNLAP